MAGLAEILDENTALRAQLRAREQQVAEIDAEKERLAEKLLAITQKHDLLTKHLEWLEERRKLARAERFIADKNQTLLFEDLDVELPPRAPEPESKEGSDAAEPAPRPKLKSRQGRRKLADLALPKQKVTVRATPTTCPTCGGEHAVCGSTTSHRISWKPGHFVVQEVEREQTTCRRCPEGGVWTAPEPYLLPRAMCDDSLLARVVVDRHADHLPFNRQANRMKREGFEVGTNVLAGWSGRGFEQVRPVVEALSRQVVDHQLVLSDDTGSPVQDSGDGTLRKGRMWVFTDQRQAFFAFSPNKNGEHPAAILSALGMSGTLVADGGSEYNEVTRELGLVRGGCWSHLRRYFTDAAVQHDIANAALATIQDLFMIERECAGLSPPERLAVRQERSLPLVEGLYRWIEAMTARTRPESKLGAALGYANSQKSRMLVFLQDGRVPMHNNLSELLLRQHVVGRKNWLFSRSEGGAHAGAGWLSLVESAKLQGLDPHTYLVNLFRRLPDHPRNRVDELTPMNWRLAVERGEIAPISRPTE